MKGFVDGLGWDSSWTRNLANVFSVELSLVYSFVVYRLFVWDDVMPHRSAVTQLVRYHASAGTTILTRWFVLFPVLDALGVDFVWNTILGALAGCALNFAITNRYVFAKA